MKSCKSNKLLVKSTFKTYFDWCFGSPIAFFKQAFLFIVLLSFNASAIAQQCADIFAHGAQSNLQNGRISFDFQAQLLNNPSTVLNATSVSVNGGSPTSSCGNVACTASGEPTPRVQVNFSTNDYPDSNFNVSYAQTRRIGDDGNGDYQNININSSAKLEFSDNVTVYRIRKLSVGYNSQVDLTAGDYWIDELVLNSQTKINVIGDGTVRIYVNKGVRLGYQSRVNYIEGATQQFPHKLVLYSNQEIQFNTETKAAGSFYSNNSISLNYAVEVYGAVNANNISLNTQAIIEYDSALLPQTQFASFCQSSGGVLDLDGDGIPDDQDSDRDGDGVDNDQDVFPNDATESSDLDGDGIGDNADSDRDGDGFDNDVEETNNTDPSDPNSVPADLDGDFIPDNVDTDRDGDGVDNNQDAFPNDPNESGDIDGDGIGNNADTDRDGDGFTNDIEVEYETDPNDPASSPVDTDGDFIPDDIDIDRDGDGINNDNDAFPDDATETSDIDGDGVGDNADVDRDGDGISNEFEEQLGTDPNDPLDKPSDLDGDGVPDAADSDIDGDGIANDQDAFPIDPTESSDLDSDGIGDNSDLDRDGDGFNNDVEAQFNTDSNDPTSFPSDIDGDNIPDDIDDDRDGDGVNNSDDVFPDDATETTDLDNDGVGDNSDTDRDGDGFENEVEAQYNTDPNNPLSFPPDADSDGIPDDIDDDRDGDGVGNSSDAFPDNANESSDLDGDGIGDNSDSDRDGDGFSNEIEEQLGSDPNNGADSPLDADGDGIADALDDDRDGDGVNNDQDLFPNDPNESSDLDGDGIGDNTDTDRDGDGFSNDDEINRGTAPNDANDYPDDVAPNLTVNNINGQSTEATSINIIGSAIDPTQPNSGIASIVITTDRFPDTSFSGAIDSVSGFFNVDVPLKVEENTLIVIVTDLSGNQTQESIAISRLSPPEFVNVSPINGSLSLIDSITIKGEIHTLLPVDALTFFINESQVTPLSTTDEGIYSFDFPNVQLQFGDNVFTLLIRSDDGIDQKIITVNYVPGDAQDILPPSINLIAPSNGAVLNQSSFRVSAQVQSFAGPLTIRVNNQTILAATEGLSNYSFSELLSFDEASNQQSIIIEAQDSLGRISTLEPSFNFDNQGPVIVLENAITPLPAINDVDGSPILIAGTVTDNNLSSLLINNQPVSLAPGNDESSYIFRASLPIGIGETKQLNIQAFDRSGNKVELEYSLQNIATSSITILSPSNDTNFIDNGDAVNVSVVARLTGLANDYEGTAVAYIQGTTSETPLSINGDLASGNLNLIAGSPEQSIVVELRDSLGQLSAQSSTQVSLTNLADVSIELVRVEPVNNAQFIEPNAPIELYFNREIDLQLLDVSVKETMHGQTYLNSDELGEDFINSVGYQLTQVNRDLETVAGQLELIPGGAGVVFNANSFFGYNAELFVTVSYDGQQLDRSNFRVRELPTFINGAIIDQFGQPIRGIEVSIPELERTTVTNGDGGFAFGYQESGDQVIEGGEYQLQVNANLNNTRFGSINKKFSVQRNRRNEFDRLTLQELDRAIPFYNINSGQQNELIGGDLKIDLSGNAKVLFSSGRTSGAIHAQFLPFEHIGVRVFEGAAPHWLFGIQPKGIGVEGDVTLQFKIPMLRNSYDYITPELFEYVILLGFNAQGEVMEPIGVGIIEGLYVTSVGKVNLSSLDYLGYALPIPTQADELVRYANGEISLLQLKALIQVQ